MYYFASSIKSLKYPLSFLYVNTEGIQKHHNLLYTSQPYSAGYVMPFQMPIFCPHTSTLSDFRDSCVHTSFSIKHHLN